MYQSECAPKEVRAVVVVMYQLFVTLGILLASILNYGTKGIQGSASWRITIGVGLLWPLVLGIGIQFMDESPRWDISNGREDRARRTLSRLYATELQAHREQTEIQNAVQMENEREKTSLKGLWSEPTILRRILVAMAIQMGQQLTGINYFFYYGTELFASLGVGDGYVTAMILGVVNFAATFLGLWAAKRFGHRSALLAGAIWIGIALMVCSISSVRPLYIKLTWV